MADTAARSRRRLASPIRYGIAAALLVAVAVGAWRWDRDDAPATAPVTRGRLAVTIDTAGTLVPGSERTIAAPVAGTVLRLGVEPGDRIAAGDIVALLDPQPFQDRLDAAIRVLGAAEYAAQVAPSPATPSAAGAAIAAAVGVAEARAAVEAARRALAAATILAPEPGTVLEVAAVPGNALPPGAPIARLASAAPLAIRADLDEIDLPRVAIGTAVQVTVDAFPGTAYAGIIAQVAPEGIAQGGGVVFPIRIVLADPGAAGFPPELRPGLSAVVAIPAVVAENTLLVPEGAVTTVGRRSFVVVDRDGDAIEIEIRPGLRADGQVELLAGAVEEGERVRLDGSG